MIDTTDDQKFFQLYSLEINQQIFKIQFKLNIIRYLQICESYNVI